MYKRILSSLVVFGVMLSMGKVASARHHSSTSQHGITISCDTDCWVEIDKKVVGYVEKNQRALFPVSSGNHAVAAATREGDLWEQQVDTKNATNQALIIFFRKQHSDRVLMEQDVTDLQKRLTQKEAELAQIKRQNDSGKYPPEITAEERQLIVKAIDIYAARYGSELDLRDSRKQESQGVSDAAQQEYLQNYFQNYGNTPGETATLGVYGLELLAAHRLRVKAHRHQLAVQAASLRMQYLGDLLQDPVSPFRSSLQPDYMTMQRDVVRKKSHGELVTAPGWIEYSDSSGALRVSCSDVKKAKGEKRLIVEYASQTEGKKKKKKKIRSFALKAARKSERAYLLGDVYLACPALTE